MSVDFCRFQQGLDRNALVRFVRWAILPIGESGSVGNGAGCGPCIGATAHRAGLAFRIAGFLAIDAQKSCHRFLIKRHVERGMPLSNLVVPSLLLPKRASLRQKTV